MTKHQNKRKMKTVVRFRKVRLKGWDSTCDPGFSRWNSKWKTLPDDTIKYSSYKLINVIIFKEYFQRACFCLFPTVAATVLESRIEF